jgi:hypothetical protein
MREEHVAGGGSVEVDYGMKSGHRFERGMPEARICAPDVIGIVSQVVAI